MVEAQRPVVLHVHMQVDSLGTLLPGPVVDTAKKGPGHPSPTVAVGDGDFGDIETPSGAREGCEVELVGGALEGANDRRHWGLLLGHFLLVAPSLFAAPANAAAAAAASGWPSHQARGALHAALDHLLPGPHPEFLTNRPIRVGREHGQPKVGHLGKLHDASDLGLHVEPCAWAVEGRGEDSRARRGHHALEVHQGVRRDGLIQDGLHGNAREPCPAHATGNLDLPGVRGSDAGTPQVDEAERCETQ
mmetsp:Transcript_13968/g.40911  ORF Transcript_13968/g.40911 Transcript_13968/m.40911 type:complete len:247 (-) Transcript_13968:115-855(-)